MTWGITSGAVDVLLGINAVHLHPREEELRSEVKLLHSCVSGNYLLTGRMIAGSTNKLANPARIVEHCACSECCFDAG